jgi:asparagine synthase (glutamine-hydrolysing)
MLQNSLPPKTGKMMCGIGGILVHNPGELERAHLARLVTDLAHRGPNGNDIWVNNHGTAGFVHTRLAILDTSDRGKQPMRSVDGAYTIVFNGEIYNFLELRAELESLGSRFQSDSDTEVILESWRHWGEGMLLRFNGMWAFAIHDNRSGETFLSRDRFGIKPLLYAHIGNRFAFASEMRALLSIPWISSELDPEVTKHMLLDPFSVEGSDRSVFSSIRRLPGGHCAWLREGRLNIRRWWSTIDHLIEAPQKSEDQADRFRELFFDSVRLRLRSDVSVGTCLSGGFDSTAVACAMSKVGMSAGAHPREAQNWRHAFIASFPGYSNEETSQALEAATYAQVTPHIYSFRSKDALDNVDTVLDDLDDIYIGIGTAPWRIYRELRDSGVVVSLDGHGADELLGGYYQGSPFRFALRNTLESIGNNKSNLAQAARVAKTAYLSAQGLNFVRGHKVVPPERPLIPSESDVMPKHWGVLNKRLYRMFHATVLPTILRNFDRLSMAHGVEVRMPFMDWRLVVFAMSLPDAAKLKDGLSKVIARRAMMGFMPERIRLARTKVGFNSPMPELLNESLGIWASNLLSRSDDQFDTLVESRTLRQRVDGLNASRAWNWQRAGRLWPYIQLKWLLGQQVSKK